jgi:hypothetical protein
VNALFLSMFLIAQDAAPIAPAPAPAVEGVKRIAVMKTDVAGDVDAALGPQVTARLADEIRRATGAQVISSDEMIALLKHEKDRAILGDCKEDESCIAEIAQALGADVVVAAKLSKVENAIGLAVSAVDAHSAGVKGRVNETWGGDVVNLLTLIKPVVVKLFATPGSGVPTGRVDVVGAIAGSRIYVDGEARGTAELARIDGLVIGGHRVLVTHPDHKAFERWVVVEGPPVALSVSQEPIDEGLGGFWFWTAAGGGIAVVGATVLVVAVALSGNRTGVNVQVNADETLGGAR